MSYQSQTPWAASTTSLTSPTLLKLIEASPHEVDTAPLDYLFIELVDTFRRSAALAFARFKRIDQELQKAGIESENESKKKKTRGQSSEDELEQLLITRLERAGSHVGSCLTERLLKDRSRFSDPLDSIKFVCKDVWTTCWGKQVDNLRTNHRGVYIIQDNSFRPIRKLSSWDGPDETLRLAKLHVYFTLGLLRGVLQKLDLHVTVTMELSHPPQCGFQIRISKS